MSRNFLTPHFLKTFNLYFYVGAIVTRIVCYKPNLDAPGLEQNRLNRSIVRSQLFIDCTLIPNVQLSKIHRKQLVAVVGVGQP